MKLDVINSLHDRANAVLLVKAALSSDNAQSLYKGDVAGHDFHGNQWTGGHGGEAALQRLWETGGATYNPLTGDVPIKGNVVSIYPQHSVAIDVKDFKPSDTSKYLKAHEDLLKEPGHYAGYWHDLDTDKICMDISVVVASHDDAINLCIEHDQKGYYNIEENKYYEVNANATSGGALKGDSNEKNSSVFRKVRPEESSSFSRRDEQTNSEVYSRQQRSESTKRLETLSLVKAAIRFERGTSLYKGVR